MNWLRKKWCDWTHGGGHLERDEQDRLNWRCARCGRWGDHPLQKSDEAMAIERIFADYEGQPYP